MIFRRPELEKDNPIAPQPYVGPRRRLALARVASLGKLAEVDDVKEMLQTLTMAASRVLNSLPKAREKDPDLKVLRNAIAQVERMLSAEGRSRT